MTTQSEQTLEQNLLAQLKSWKQMLNRIKKIIAYQPVTKQNRTT